MAATVHRLLKVSPLKDEDCEGQQKPYVGEPADHDPNEIERTDCVGLDHQTFNNKPFTIWQDINRPNERSDGLSS